MNDSPPLHLLPRLPRPQPDSGGKHCTKFLTTVTQNCQHQYRWIKVKYLSISVCFLSAATDAQLNGGWVKEQGV